MAKRKTAAEICLALAGTSNAFAKTEGAKMDDMTTRERADAILATKRRCNIPHPEDKGMRIVGFIVDENVAGLGMALLALDDIADRAKSPR